MPSGRPSRTALSSAHARAVHQTADAPPVFADPLALRIVGGPGPSYGPNASGGPESPNGPGGPPGSRPGPPPMPTEVRLFMALRHRVAEDALRAATGVRQVVVLGAGLDTFAYRNTDPTLRVFEVDLPATQAWKRERLAAAGIGVPDTVVYCPVDFAAQTAESGLAAVGFDRRVPSFFLLLGVAPYLERDALLATAGFVAGLPAPADLVLDYNQPATALPPHRRPARAAQVEAMERMGEPWRSYFTPPEIAAALAGVGFTDVADVGWGDCLARYGLDPALPDLIGGRIVHARTTRGRTRGATAADTTDSHPTADGADDTTGDRSRERSQ